MNTTRNLRILVLGSSGMLGWAVLKSLAAERTWTVERTQRTDPAAPLYLDAERALEDWHEVLRAGRYDYLINCIGVLKSSIDELETSSLLKAITVNSLFPHRLASATRTLGTRVIHISTDGVFSGISGQRVETDPADCRDTYGRTKVLGESPAGNVINIRCSLIGRDPGGKKGLLEWALRNSDGAELPGFADQLWNGVTTTQFSELCRRILQSDSFDQIRRASNIHHFCPNPPITKYELLCLVKQAANLNVTIRKTTSDEPGNRVLGTIYSKLSALYPDQKQWLPVISEAFANT